MKQEKQETTIADYHNKHNKHKKPVKKYHVLKIRNDQTGLYRWAVVWFTGNGEMYQRFPMTYGMRAAVRLANRLQKEHDKKRQIVEMARNRYTIGI